MTSHDFKAILVDGCIKVTDPEGSEVKVSYGATLGRTTVTAFIPGVGFIGGWTGTRKRPFTDLVESINRGICYHDMNDLGKPADFVRTKLVNGKVVPEKMEVPPAPKPKKARKKKT